MDDRMSERLHEAGVARVVKDWDEAAALFAQL